MDEPHLWTEPELVAFTGHAADDVRAWAWHRLLLHHPDVAGRLAPQGLADRSPFVVGWALDALAKRPTPEGRAALKPLGKRRELPRGMHARVARLARGERIPEEVPHPLDAEQARLTAAPAELRERAPTLLASASSDDRALALHALGEQPYRWAATLVLERLDALVATEDHRLARETLHALGDVRALAAFLADWRPDDRRLAAYALRLHLLAGAEGALPEALLRDAAEHARALAELQQIIGGSMDAAVLAARTLRLDLRCTVCAHVHEYDAGRIMVHPDSASCARDGWDGVTLGRIVVCKTCGAEDAYELTYAEKRRVTAALGAPELAPHGAFGENPLSAPVVWAAAKLWDGTPCRRPTEALRHLRALAERRPTHGEGWRHLGNLCELYDRPDEAVAAWRRAALDEDELEACYSLAKHYDEAGHAQEAFEHACATLARLRRVDDESDPTIRGMAVELGLGLVRETLSRTREPIALLASWTDFAAATPTTPAVAATPTTRTAAATPTLYVSSVDLRKVRHWDRLVDLFMSDAFVGARVTPELPEEPVTQLSRLLEGGSPLAPRYELLHGPALARPAVSRQGPCPCGSGKKYKRCCGRERR